MQLAPMVAASDAHGWSLPLLQSSLGSHDCYVLEDGTALLGLAVFQQVLDEVELLYLVIDQAYQGRGLGYAFLQATLLEMSKKGAGRCFLEVRASNQSAQHLYRKAGFQIVGLRKGYYPDPQAASGREDARLLSRDLVSVEYFHENQR